MAKLRAVKVATWNVNSLRAREGLVLDWLDRTRPDVVCLQETKVTDADFPSLEFQLLGYRVAFAGEKSYNGVAIASRSSLDDVRVGLVDGTDTDAKRCIGARIGDVWVYSCYVPNGRSLESEQFQEKLLWLEHLKRTLEQRHSPNDSIVVCGDFNVAREARDLFDPKAFEGKTHFHPEEHARIDALLDFGLVDAFRLHDDRPQQYTWWDYRAGAFRRNLGMRIDYLFVTAALAERCERVVIDVVERKKPKPSDHTPVVAYFRDIQEPSPK
jgi:exodeoxyribonuclease III